MQKELDVPTEVLAALPSVDEIRAKAEAAHAKARAAIEAADAAADDAASGA